MSAEMPHDLVASIPDALVAAFSDGSLFRAGYVNDRRYLQMCRLHSRVCGILAGVGVKLGLTPDVGRKLPIDPYVPAGGRRQLQAEADVIYVAPGLDAPVAALDYETSDAPINKMTGKFGYFRSFRAHTPTLQVLGLLITVTDVQHGWTDETPSQRRQFAEHDAPEFIAELMGLPANRGASFLFGVFGANRLTLHVYDESGQTGLLETGYEE